MPKDARPVPPDPIGVLLRRQRTEVLRKGLIETANLLDIAPPHLTDIEKGRRNPSEELLLRMVKIYGLSEAQLRAGWSKAHAVVNEVATENPTNAEKVPQFLRTARALSAEQWDQLIRQAERLTSRDKKEPRK